MVVPAVAVLFIIKRRPPSRLLPMLFVAGIAVDVDGRNGDDDDDDELMTD